MNLFHNPTLTELNSSIDRFVKEPTLLTWQLIMMVKFYWSLKTPIWHLNWISLNSTYATCGCKKCIRTGSLKDIRLLRMLYNRLMYSWRKDLRGNLADLIINPLNNQGSRLISDLVLFTQEIWERIFETLSFFLNWLKSHYSMEFQARS